MKKLALLAIPALLLVATPAFADDAAPVAPAAPDTAAAPQGPQHQHLTPDERAKRKAEWEAMTPEQRKAKMDELIAKREAAMTPDQKAAFEAKRAKWEAMTPEQRKAAREEHRAQHHGGKKGAK